MHVAELWRFPVKSMAGEPLGRADVRPDGIVGDRVAYVLGAHGRIVTARTRPRLLGHRASLGMDGEPQVDGRPWRAPGVERDVVAAVGVGASLVLANGLERFDVLPLLVATDGAIRALGADGRRLRPNIVIGGVSGLAERTWEGARLRIGDVVIGVQDLRQRCIMTTFDPDTLEQDAGVSWIGVAIPASSAKRETAPLRMSSSVGPPVSRSTRKLGFIAGGRPSITPSTRATSSSGRPMPRARATATISSIARCNRRRPSGAARSGPMGERASPHAAASAVRNTNFCHSSTWIRSDARASIPAFRNAPAIRSTRSLVRPSGSPTTTI